MGITANADRLPVLQDRASATWSINTSDGAAIDVTLNRRTGRLSAVEMKYNERKGDWVMGMTFSEPEARHLYLRHRLIVCS